MTYSAGNQRSDIIGDHQTQRYFTEKIEKSNTLPEKSPLFYIFLRQFYQFFLQIIAITPFILGTLWGGIISDR